MSSRRKQNAAARREQARREAERLQRVRRRNRVLVAAVVVVVAALVAVAGIVIWRGSQRSYLEDVPRAPEGSDLGGGVPVLADGTPADAPRLDVYLDYQSAASVAFWEHQGEDLQALSDDGTVALWLHFVGFEDGGINGFSTRPAQAALVVADRAPESFLAFTDAAFQLRIGGAEQINDPDLVGLSRDLGISTDVSDRFDDNLFNDWCVAATDQAAREGVETTPVVRLDGDDLDADWGAAGALTTAVTDALGD